MAKLLAAACWLHLLAGHVTQAGGVGWPLVSANPRLTFPIAPSSVKSYQHCNACDMSSMIQNCPLDVMFVWDMSESIPPITFQQTREYVARTIRTVTEAFQNTQVGVMVFSDVIYKSEPLVERSPAELEKLIGTVRGLQQQRLGKAEELGGPLKEAVAALERHQQAATVLPWRRRGQLIVLLTDGCDDVNEAVEAAAIRAATSDIQIISVALGRANMGLLKKISLQLLELRTDIDWPSTVACPTTYLPPVQSTTCSNVMFVMDGSSSVRRFENVTRDYLAYTALRYRGVNNAIGVIVFGTNVTQQSQDTMIPPTVDKARLADQIEFVLRFPEQRGTGTTEAIQLAVQRLLDYRGVTQGVRNTIIVVTDGPALNPHSAQQALANATRLGLQVIVVGVGEVVSLAELQLLAGSGSIAIQVASYLDLFGLDLSEYLCPAKSGCSAYPECPLSNLQYKDQNCQCMCRPQTCTQFKVFNPSTCQCECQPRSCPVGQTLNPNTCSCECQPRSCPSGQSLNPNTCSCDCSALGNCPLANQYRDPNQNCQCVSTCNSLGLCPLPNQVRDPNNNCQCQCQSRSCPSGQTLNPNTCSCDCSTLGNCPLANQYRDPNQNCQCVSICNSLGPCPLSNQVRDPNNGCQCRCSNTINCGAGQTQDPNSCQCVCSYQTCPPFQEFNTSSCLCARLLCGISCSANSYRNSTFSPCECVCSNTIVCGTGYRLNPTSCGCEPICTNTINCATGQRFDPNICQCVPNCQVIQSCGPGSVFDTTTCRCEPVCRQTVPCPSGTYFDEISCRCRCLQSEACQTGYNFDANLCRCEPVCRQTVPCPSGTYFDEINCRCISLCTNQCPANFVLNSVNCGCECRTTCPAGQTLNQATCSCSPTTDPATARPLCTASEIQCQNGQPAYKDCQGRCTCSCNPSLYTGTYCEIRVEASLCENCTYNNGHYIAALRGRCDMFVQCERLGDNSFLPHIQFCPPGTILAKQGPLILCTWPQLGFCSQDPCASLPTGARYAHSSHCAKYWECVNGRTAAEGCCKQGEGFDAAQGRCVPNRYCPNTCAPDGGFVSCSEYRVLGPPACPLRANPANRRQFYHSSDTEKRMSACQNSHFFNETSCLCEPEPTSACIPDYNIHFDTTDLGVTKEVIREITTPGSTGTAGYFNGNSRVVLHRFSGSGFHFDFFQVALRFKLADNATFSSGRETAIISNGDCQVTESIAVTVDAQNVYFKVVPVGETRPTVATVPYTRTGDGWVTLKFEYQRQGNNFALTGTVNGQSRTQTASGIIDERVCALQIGHGLGYDSFRGYVDDVLVYTCKP